jgi:hypothetical protein
MDEAPFLADQVAVTSSLGRLESTCCSRASPLADEQAAQFAGAPDDEREGERERGAAEQEPVGEHADRAQRGVAVRTAKAVPIWQATMPSQATVVACW